MLFRCGIVVENDNTTLPTHEAHSAGIQGRLVECSVHELRPHPNYSRHGLSVQPSQFAALARLGDLAFQYPLIITTDRLVIDGYGRWELAKRAGRSTLPCIENDVTDQYALEWLIQTHRPSQGLSDFVRIKLALDLEPHLEAKAMLNRQAGGRLKGLSKLTGAEKVNTRREVARVAQVSVGNVHKVKYILANAEASLKEAVRSAEISINVAEKWSHEPEAKQREYLRLWRIERGIKRKARNLVAGELARISASKHDEQVFTLSDLLRLFKESSTIAPEQTKKFDSIPVKLADGAGWAIFVTEELMHALTPLQKVLVG